MLNNINCNLMHYYVLVISLTMVRIAHELIEERPLKKPMSAKPLQGLLF
jgi:hypothetical protein